MEIGRNAPCPCGSGKKYKRCCLEKHLQAQRREQVRNMGVTFSECAVLRGENWRKARKYYSCDICSGGIDKGDSYLMVDFIHEGHYGHNRLCRTCASIHVEPNDATGITN